MRLTHCAFLAMAVFSMMSMVACDRSAPAPTVTLYSSIDGTILREVVAAYEAETGVTVNVLGDTEATKTTGLVERVLAERDRPRADVWWSSEPFGTIRLAQAGVLAPHVPEALSASWPPELRGEGDLWFGVGMRARVIAYASDRLAPEQVPQTLRELTDERLRGRVGIAQPQFGTTRGHMGALAVAWGEDELEAWLADMVENDMRVYDGNATIVQAIARGEIDVGLTDTDDVFAAQRQGWSVGMVLEPLEVPGRGPRWSIGAMGIPTTAALVAGAPQPDEARRLLEWIASGKAEAVLAASEARFAPVSRTVAMEHPEATLDGVVPVDLAAVADAIDNAMAITTRTLP